MIRAIISVLNGQNGLFLHMTQCYRPGDFEKYFKENMEGLGLPVPKSLFMSYQTGVATGAALSGFLWQFGKGTTVGVMLGGSYYHEKFLLAAAIGGSYYTGAVIGSIAIASGRSLGCGYRLADMMSLIHENKMEFPGWETFYNMEKQVMDKNYHGNRKTAGEMARVRPQDSDYRNVEDEHKARLMRLKR